MDKLKMHSPNLTQDNIAREGIEPGSRLRLVDDLVRAMSPD